MNIPPENEPSGQEDKIPLNVVYLGRTRYAATWRLQKQLVNDRAADKITDTLLVTDHEPVITKGRGTNDANLLVSPEKLQEMGIDLFEVERGGDITFHGPEQLVVYPIISLASRDKDTHKYLRELEKVVINTLGNLGLTGTTKQGLTGVWIGDTKVCAIGVGVSKWITYHGLALNVNTDMNYFKLITPCGINNYPVGSLKTIIGTQVNYESVTRNLVTEFAKIFEYNEINDDSPPLSGSH